MKKWIGPSLILIALSFILLNLMQKEETVNDNVIVEDVQPQYEYGILVDSLNVTKGVVKNGQTFGEILYAHHIDHPQIAEIVLKSKEIFDFRRVNTGKEYTVISAKDSIKKAYYFIYQTNEMNSYRNAYKQRIRGDFTDEYTRKILFNDQLIEGMNFHKNYRDLSILWFVGVYLLNVLDANVGAHLLQFNVNDDLSITPNIIVDKEITGLQLAVKF